MPEESIKVLQPEEGDFSENLHPVVYAIINKHSFESFVCLDLILERWQSFLFQIFVCLAGEKEKCPEGSRRLPAAVHSDHGVCLAGEMGEDTRAIWGLKLVFILTIGGYAVCLAGEGGSVTRVV